MLRRNHPNGFTIMELLVVIAVLAMLIALLLPSLQMVREVAVRAQCQTNIRAIGQGVTNYSLNYDQHMPIAYIRAASTHPTGDVFSNILVREGFMTAPDGLAARSPFRCPSRRVIEENADRRWPGASGPHTTARHFNYFYPYRADNAYSGSSHHDGPGDPQTIDGVNVPTWYMLAAGNHSNWTFYMHLSDNTSSTINWSQLRRIPQVTDPANRVLAAEQSSPSASSPVFAEGRISARHVPFTSDGDDGISSFAFFDGSVRGVDTQDWYAGLDVSPIRYLWSE